MADTVFKGVGVAGSDLKAVDLGDGKFGASVSTQTGADPAQDSIFNTGPPLKAVFLGVDGGGDPIYGVAAVIV